MDKARNTRPQSSKKLKNIREIYSSLIEEEEQCYVRVSSERFCNPCLSVVEARLIWIGEWSKRTEEWSLATLLLSVPPGAAATSRRRLEESLFRRVVSTRVFFRVGSPFTSEEESWRCYGVQFFALPSLQKCHVRRCSRTQHSYTKEKGSRKLGAKNFIAP